MTSPAPGSRQVREPRVRPRWDVSDLIGRDLCLARTRTDAIRVELALACGEPSVVHGRLAVMYIDPAAGHVKLAVDRGELDAVDIGLDSAHIESAAFHVDLAASRANFPRVADGLIRLISTLPRMAAGLPRSISTLTWIAATLMRPC